MYPGHYNVNALCKIMTEDEWHNKTLASSTVIRGRVATNTVEINVNGEKMISSKRFFCDGTTSIAMSAIVNINSQDHMILKTDLIYGLGGTPQSLVLWLQ